MPYRTLNLGAAVRVDTPHWPMGPSKTIVDVDQDLPPKVGIGTIWQLPVAREDGWLNEVVRRSHMWKRLTIWLKLLVTPRYTPPVAPPNNEFTVEDPFELELTLNLGDPTSGGPGSDFTVGRPAHTAEYNASGLLGFPAGSDEEIVGVFTLQGTWAPSYALTGATDGLYYCGLNFAILEGTTGPNAIEEQRLDLGTDASTVYDPEEVEDGRVVTQTFQPTFIDDLSHEWPGLAPVIRVTDPAVDPEDQLSSYEITDGTITVSGVEGPRTE